MTLEEIRKDIEDTENAINSLLENLRNRHEDLQIDVMSYRGKYIPGPPENPHLGRVDNRTYIGLEGKIN